MEEASPLDRKKMPRKKQGIVSSECKYWEIVVARGGIWPEPRMLDPIKSQRLVTGRLQCARKIAEWATAVCLGAYIDMVRR